MRIRVMGLVMGALVCGAGNATAQVAWDAPLLVPPRVDAGFGVYLMDPDGGDIGVMGTWRPEQTRLGLRAGLADDAADDVSFFAGADFSRLIATVSREFPLDVAWVIGGGAGFGDHVLFSFPAALTVGRTFSDDDAHFTPFASPRVMLDVAIGDGDDEFDLGLAFDLGLDVAFQPDWKVRFGATFGDREALGIGVVF